MNHFGIASMWVCQAADQCFSVSKTLEPSQNGKVSSETRFCGLKSPLVSVIFVYLVHSYAPQKPRNKNNPWYPWCQASLAKRRSSRSSRGKSPRGTVVRTKSKSASSWCGGQKPVKQRSKRLGELNLRTKL